MDYLKLLQRTDYYEITGNRMTSYGSTLGGGSIFYWDGRVDSFDPRAPLCSLTAFVEVLDERSGLNLVQQMYHFWRPDRVINRFHSHGRSYIEEEKTIHDDTFVSIMDFHSEQDVKLRLRLAGKSGSGARLRLEGDILIMDESLETKPDQPQTGSFKAVLLSGASCRLEKESYVMEMPLSLGSVLTGDSAQRSRILLVVAGGDTEAEALERCRRAAADPQSLFEAREREWRDYFRDNVPAFSCDNPAWMKMYYFIYYMVRSNIYKFGRGYFRQPFESTGKFRLLPQWFWDSAFGAMNEKWLNDLPLPRSSMSNTIEAQRGDGLLPFNLCIDQYGNRIGMDIIQPFILPMAVWDYYLKSGDRDFLVRALPVLARFDAWMMANRDANHEELVDLKVPGESGWDNSKRYILGSRLRQAESPMMREKRYVQSPDFNTYVYVGRCLMARMAAETGDREAASGWSERAGATARGIESMWSEDTGLYMDRFEDNHERIPIRTPGGVIPLLGGLGDEIKAERINGNLTDPDLFWTEYPVTTLDLTDPDYNDRDEYFSYWNGRVWPNINWVIIEALCRAGKLDTAAELIRRSLNMCNATGEAWCMENYHPQTGYPYFTHNIFNYIWGGMFNDMLLRRVMGIQGDAPRNEVTVNPLFNEDIGRAAVKDIRVGGHSLDIALRKQAGGGLHLTFTHRGQQPIRLLTSVGETTVHNGTEELDITRFDARHWLEF